MLSGLLIDRVRQRRLPWGAQGEEVEVRDATVASLIAPTSRPIISEDAGGALPRQRHI